MTPTPEELQRFLDVATEAAMAGGAQMGMLALMVHDKLGNVADFFP